MHVKLKRRRISIGRYSNLPPRPDVRRVPDGSHMRARRAAGAKTAGALLPGTVIEVCFKPAVGGRFGGIAPDDTVASRSGLDHLDCWRHGHRRPITGELLRSTGPLLPRRVVRQHPD